MFQSLSSTSSSTFNSAVLVVLLLVALLHNADSFSPNAATAARPPSRGLIESAFGQSYREINTSRQYADAINPRVLVEESKFEQQMRKLLEDQKKLMAKESVATAPKPVIQQVLTLKEYESAVLQETDKMVVVRFHAPWCRACKATKPSFEKFAKEHADTIKFIECPMTAVNTEVHQTLGIRTIPFAHVYHPTAGLVEQRKLSRPHYGSFEKMMKDYMGGECAIKDDEALFDPYPLVPRVEEEEDA